MIKNIVKFSQVFLIAMLLTACNGETSQVETSDTEVSKAEASNGLVTNQQEFNEAVKNAQPGDIIVMQNGVWNDFEMVFDAQGTKDNPITLTVQEKGKVIISGQSNLRLAGEHLIVSD